MVLVYLFEQVVGQMSLTSQFYLVTSLTFAQSVVPVYECVRECGGSSVTSHVV